MRSTYRTLVAAVLLLLAVPAAEGQERRWSGEWAWTPLLRHEGVAFDYIFYSEADNVNNGVVIRLHNQNEYAVSLRFLIVFRSDGAEHSELFRGRLDAGEMRTGDAAGLFWVPFPDGRTIGEIGLRGYRVTPLRGDSAPDVRPPEGSR